MARGRPDSGEQPVQTGPDGNDAAEPFVSPALYLPPLSPNESPEPAAALPAPTPTPRRRWHWWYVLVLAVLVGAITLTVLLTPNGSRPETITVPTELPVSQLRVGDCLNPVPYGQQVATATVVPCAQYHGGEVIALITVDDGPYSDGQVAAEVATACSAQAEPYIRKLTELGSAGGAQSTYMYPSKEGFEHGDRQGLCIVYAPGGSIPGSLVEATHAATG